MVGAARPEHLPYFRTVTGYRGPLYADPSLASFSAADLASGWGRTLHPLSVLKGVRALAQGFKQGARQGDPIQQGGVFVLGPGERVRYEWRDRFAGDNAPRGAVLDALA